MRFIKEIQEEKNRIWDGGLAKVCDGYEQADEGKCKAILEEIETFEVPNERK